MSTYAVIKTGGKQYIAQEGSELVVDHIEGVPGTKVELATLATFTADGKVELGAPELSKKVSAEIIESGKGEKIRIAKFKSKVRFRRVTGFRSALTKIKVISI